MGSSICWNNFRSVFIIAGLLILCISCTTAPSTSMDQTVTIAVWDLENLTPTGQGQTGMAELFTSQVIARLDETKGFQVVERQQLSKAMEELSIGSSELSDATTRLKLGKLLGANQMVFGAFQVIGEQVRLDLRRVDVSTGKILKTAGATAAADDVNSWISAADQLAKELVQ